MHLKFLDLVPDVCLEGKVSQIFIQVLKIGFKNAQKKLYFF